MDILLLILAFVCMAVGIIGCIVPGLPGTPIAFAGLLIAQATERVDLSWQVLLIWGIVTVVVSVLDYVVPAWGTKRFGGTRYGVWGSTIGVCVGLFFGPWGVIVGPLLGAVLGELIGGKETQQALRAGWGSFLGLLCGTIIKLVCCGMMVVTLIQACTAEKQDTEEQQIAAAVERQLKDYPESHLQDVYKAFYQEFFGAEHLITDTASVANYLHNEIAESAVDTISNPYSEEIGAERRYVRVYLRCVTEGLLTEECLMKAFLMSAVRKSEPTVSWEERWQKVADVVCSLESQPHGMTEELPVLAEYSRQKAAVRHSQQYRDRYHPHYRIVERGVYEEKIAPYLR